MADSNIVRRVREKLAEQPLRAFVFSRYPVFLEQAASLFSPSEAAEWLDPADYIRGRYARQIQRLEAEGVRWGSWEPWGMLSALAFLPLPEDERRRLAGAVTNWRADTLFTSNRAMRRIKNYVSDHEDIELFDLYAEGVASWRTGDAPRAHTLAETLLDRGAVSQENKLGLMLGYTLEAFLSMEDAETALGLLDQANVWLGLPGGGNSWYQNRHGRFLRAELLLRLGDYEEALRWYESLEGYTVSTSIMLGPRTYRMAQCLDALGRSAEAAEAYARFIELWEEADPALQVMVDDARQRLATALFWL